MSKRRGSLHGRHKKNAPKVKAKKLPQGIRNCKREARTQAEELGLKNPGPYINNILKAFMKYFLGLDKPKQKPHRMTDEECAEYLTERGWVLGQRGESWIKGHPVGGDPIYKTLRGAMKQQAWWTGKYSHEK